MIKQPIRVARFMRGECGICHKMILPGEAYETGCGKSMTRNVYIAHYTCYKPDGAPTYEELKERGLI